MLTFRKLPPDEVPWDTLDRYPDRIIFQTRPWLQFIAACQQATPVVIEIREDQDVAGYLTLMLTKKMALKILGSPFHGWTTGYLGFNLWPGQSRSRMLQALPAFLYEEFGYHYFQFCDYFLQNDDPIPPGYTVEHYQNFEIDLSGSEEQLFSRVNNDCRRRVRKAEKEGVVFEEAAVDGFADEYFAQLTDVFEKHRLVPTYGVERVRTLLHYLHPTGNLLLVRARNPQGQSLATGIYSAFNGIAFAWGFASWRQYQHEFTPNEGLIWYAMKCLKRRGCTWLDLGGWAPYKAKYGTKLVMRPYLMLSRPEFIVPCKNLALSGWYQLHKQTSQLRLFARAHGS